MEPVRITHEPATTRFSEIIRRRGSTELAEVPSSTYLLGGYALSSRRGWGGKFVSSQAH
jgi:hypothetical protein